MHARAAETCSLYIDHHRPRKTGPGFPLAVVGCTRHPAGRYTLYPPGHVPHGRQAVVPCSPEHPLPPALVSGQPPWQATLFGAAVNAAAGRDCCCRHRSAGDVNHRRTRGRHLERAGDLLGLLPDIDKRIQEHIATRLRVPTMTPAYRSAHLDVPLANPGWCRDHRANSAACRRLPTRPRPGCRDGRWSVASPPALGPGAKHLGTGSCRRRGTPRLQAHRQPGAATHDFAHSRTPAR